MEKTEEVGKENNSVSVQWLGFLFFGLLFVIAIITNSSWWITTMHGFFTLLFLPLKSYQLWLNRIGEKITDLLAKLLLWSIGLAISGFVIWGGWKVLVKLADLVTPDKWTLMVCDEKLNSAECYSNSYEIPGFKSAKDCLLEGANKFSKEGFECGSNCKESDYSLKVCKEICNKSGCS